MITHIVKIVKNCPGACRRPTNVPVQMSRGSTLKVHFRARRKVTLDRTPTKGLTGFHQRIDEFNLFSGIVVHVVVSSKLAGAV